MRGGPGLTTGGGGGDMARKGYPGGLTPPIGKFWPAVNVAPALIGFGMRSVIYNCRYRQARQVSQVSERVMVGIGFRSARRQDSETDVRLGKRCDKVYKCTRDTGVSASTCSPDTEAVSRRESGGARGWPSIVFVSTQDAPHSRCIRDHLNEPDSWTCGYEVAVGLQSEQATLLAWPYETRVTQC